MAEHASIPELADAFLRLCELAEVRGLVPLKNHFAACWEEQLDSHWFVAVNGHREPKTCSKGFVVAPFEAYIEYNGFPAGSMSPRGGIIAAGSLANEDSFIAAIEKAIKRVREFPA